MKDIKDYLHLYLGCDFMWIDQVINGVSQTNATQLSYYDLHQNINDLDNIVPILRSLSSMTDDEKREYSRLDKKFNTDNILPEIKAGRMLVHHHSRRSVELTRFLLAKHFDLFDLIKSGLAIEKK